MVHQKEPVNLWLYTLGKDSSIHLIQHHPGDLEWKILIQIILQEPTLYQLQYMPYNYIAATTSKFNLFFVKLSMIIVLSNTPQVSMGYRLINHMGCW